MATPEEPVVDDVQVVVPDQDNNPGLNPAWAEVLSVLPENFHSVVTPHFQQWDSAAQSKIEAANASLKEFEDYKPYKEHGISGEEIEQGLRLYYEINNNPQGVYTALANAYNFGQKDPAAIAPGVTNTPPGDGTDNDDATAPVADDPRFSKMQEALELVSQIVLTDARAKQDANADRELETEMASLKEKNGDYDERIVLGLMSNGMSGQEAVTAFQTAVKAAGGGQSQAFAPSILGGSSGGAGIPSNVVDVTKLSGKDTRSLVEQMLKRDLG